MRPLSRLLTAALLLAACSPVQPVAESTAGHAAAAAAEAAQAEAAEAGSAYKPLQPTSDTATAITGAARLGPRLYSFAKGQNYLVAPEAKAGADRNWSAAGGTWADLLGVDAGGEVELMRVATQIVDPTKAPNGGLCGAGKVRWIVVARTADDVGAEVALAAFSGASPPGPQGRDADLCGTFSYAAGN